jgi:hypothetical protein
MLFYRAKDNYKALSETELSRSASKLGLKLPITKRIPILLDFLVGNFGIFYLSQISKPLKM